MAKATKSSLMDAANLLDSDGMDDSAVLDAINRIAELERKLDESHTREVRWAERWDRTNDALARAVELGGKIFEEVPQDVDQSDAYRLLIELNELAPQT